MTRVDVTVHGLSGPVRGAIMGQELHQDERALEAKVFAPGYGEFYSGGGHDFEDNALSVPADDLPGPVPHELRTLTERPLTLAAAARASQWTAATSGLAALTDAWKAYRAGSVPHRLATRLQLELDLLAADVGARRSRASSQAALHLADTGLDLELQYLPPATVNRARFDLWTRQLALDAAAGDAGAVVGDVTTLGWIRDRLALDDAAAEDINDQLRCLRSVADAGEFAVAATSADRLRTTLR